MANLSCSRGGQYKRSPLYISRSSLQTNVCFRLVVCVCASCRFSMMMMMAPNVVAFNLQMQSSSLLPLKLEKINVRFRHFRQICKVKMQLIIAVCKDDICEYVSVWECVCVCVCVSSFIRLEQEINGRQSVWGHSTGTKRCLQRKFRRRN